MVTLMHLYMMKNNILFFNYYYFLVQLFSSDVISEQFSSFFLDKNQFF